MTTEMPLLLIVDDEENFRHIFETKFSAAGFRVATAANGEEGIAKARELKPDLILMDVKMPGMGGTETFMKLKDDPATKDLKVLFLTSLGNPAEEAQEMNDRLSKESGAAGYLKKTDDLDTLVEQVRSHLVS